MVEEGPPDLTAIYEAYHRRVVAYASRLIGRDDADDIAHEVFVKIGRSLGSLADSSRLASWIFAITLNTVRDFARARALRASRLVASDGEESGAELSDLPDAVSRTPEEAAVRNEMVACYLEYVRQLPPSYYEVYALAELEALSAGEIASRLSISVATVKIRLHRARTKLHNQLRAHCHCYYNERGELMADRSENV